MLSSASSSMPSSSIHLAAPRTPHSYRLRILQNPVRARCCGFGNKDRRAVDPPPVVELVRIDANGHEFSSCEEAPFLVCHASLWSGDGTQDRSLVENVYAQGSGHDAADASVHAVVGSQVAIAQALRDVDDQRKMMFLYPDLSVRLPGQYSLRFQLVDVSLGPSPPPPSSSQSRKGSMVSRDAVEGRPVLAVAQSAPFESYRPKQFPGMLKSTELSRRLAEQGIVEIRARK
ncbi:velvet factor [Phlyctochytrium arcticum]|nr:velvet factor [Phlyctochytrium arcticum]